MVGGGLGSLDFMVAVLNPVGTIGALAATGLGLGAFAACCLQQVAYVAGLLLKGVQAAAQGAVTA
jgi:hypothetical protein